MDSDAPVKGIIIGNIFSFTYENLPGVMASLHKNCSSDMFIPVLVVFLFAQTKRI
jgi:hypothetical protein